MKKVIALFIAFMLLIVCSACSNQEDTSKPADSGTAKSTDSSKPIDSVTPEPTALTKASVAVGDVITFGTYPQTSEGTDQTSIEWIVLDVQNGKALLLSKYGLDAGVYDVDIWEHSTTEWETSDLRTWLNQDFYNAAFNIQEKSTILYSQLNNGSDANDTLDYVFVLSIDEAQLYFKDNLARMCSPTDYAIEKGAWTSSDLTADGRGSGAWWLRTIYNHYHAHTVNSAGETTDDGTQMDRVSILIRPAIWVYLDSGIF